MAPGPEDPGNMPRESRNLFLPLAGLEGRESDAPERGPRSGWATDRPRGSSAGRESHDGSRSARGNRPTPTVYHFRRASETADLATAPHARPQTTPAWPGHRNPPVDKTREFGVPVYPWPPEPAKPTVASPRLLERQRGNQYVVSGYVVPPAAKLTREVTHTIVQAMLKEDRRKERARARARAAEEARVAALEAALARAQAQAAMARSTYSGDSGQSHTLGANNRTPGTSGSTTPPARPKTQAELAADAEAALYSGDLTGGGAWGDSAHIHHDDEASPERQPSEKQPSSAVDAPHSPPPDVSLEAIWSMVQASSSYAALQAAAASPAEDPTSPRSRLKSVVKKIRMGSLAAQAIGMGKEAGGPGGGSKAQEARGGSRSTLTHASGAAALAHVDPLVRVENMLDHPELMLGTGGRPRPPPGSHGHLLRRHAIMVKADPRAALRPSGNTISEVIQARAKALAEALPGALAREEEGTGVVGGAGDRGAGRGGIPQPWRPRKPGHLSKRLKRVLGKLEDKNCKDPAWGHVASLYATGQLPTKFRWSEGKVTSKPAAELGSSGSSSGDEGSDDSADGGDNVPAGRSGERGDGVTRRGPNNGPQGGPDYRGSMARTGGGVGAGGLVRGGRVDRVAGSLAPSLDGWLGEDLGRAEEQTGEAGPRWGWDVARVRPMPPPRREASFAGMAHWDGGDEEEGRGEPVGGAISPSGMAGAGRSRAKAAAGWQGVPSPGGALSSKSPGGKAPSGPKPSDPHGHGATGNGTVDKPARDSAGEYVAACKRDGVLQIAAVLRKLTSQAPAFSLRHFALLPKDAAPLFRALHVAPFLTSLDLSCNNIGDPGAVAVAGLLDHGAAAITELNLSRNGIGGEGVKAIALALRPNRTVRTLNLSGNPLGDYARHLAENLRQDIDIPTNRTLTSLNLAFAGMGNVAGMSIATLLQENVTLTALNLCYSHIVTAWPAICAAVQTNTALTHLDVGQNGLGRAGTRALWTALANNFALHTLDIDRCRMGQAEMTSMAHTLANVGMLSALKHLVVDPAEGAFLVKALSDLGRGGRCRICIVSNDEAAAHNEQDYVLEFRESDEDEAATTNAAPPPAPVKAVEVARPASVGEEEEEEEEKEEDGGDAGEGDERAVDAVAGKRSRALWSSVANTVLTGGIPALLREGEEAAAATGAVDNDARGLASSNHAGSKDGGDGGKDEDTDNFVYENDVWLAQTIKALIGQGLAMARDEGNNALLIHRRLSAGAAGAVRARWEALQRRYQRDQQALAEVEAALAAMTDQSGGETGGAGSRGGVDARRGGDGKGAAKGGEEGEKDWRLAVDYKRATPAHVTQATRRLRLISEAIQGFAALRSSLMEQMSLGSTETREQEDAATFTSTFPEMELPRLKDEDEDVDEGREEGGAGADASGGGRARGSKGGGGKPAGAGATVGASHGGKVGNVQQRAGALDLTGHQPEQEGAEGGGGDGKPSSRHVMFKSKPKPEVPAETGDKQVEEEEEDDGLEALRQGLSKGWGKLAPVKPQAPAPAPKLAAKAGLLEFGKKKHDGSIAYGLPGTAANGNKGGSSGDVQGGSGATAAAPDLRRIVLKVRGTKDLSPVLDVGEPQEGKEWARVGPMYAYILERLDDVIAAHPDPDRERGHMRRIFAHTHSFLLDAFLFYRRMPMPDACQDTSAVAAAARGADSAPGAALAVPGVASAFAGRGGRWAALLGRGGSLPGPGAPKWEDYSREDAEADIENVGTSARKVWWLFRDVGVIGPSLCLADATRHLALCRRDSDVHNVHEAPPCMQPHDAFEVTLYTQMVEALVRCSVLRHKDLRSASACLERAVSSLMKMRGATPAAIATAAAGGGSVSSDGSTIGPGWGAPHEGLLSGEGSPDVMRRAYLDPDLQTILCTKSARNRLLRVYLHFAEKNGSERFETGRAGAGAGADDGGKGAAKMNKYRQLAKLAKEKVMSARASITAGGEGGGAAAGNADANATGGGSATAPPVVDANMPAALAMAPSGGKKGAGKGGRGGAESASTNAGGDGSKGGPKYSGPPTSISIAGGGQGAQGPADADAIKGGVASGTAVASTPAPMDAVAADGGELSGMGADAGSKAGEDNMVVAAITALASDMVVKSAELAGLVATMGIGEPASVGATGGEPGATPAPVVTAVAVASKSAMMKRKFVSAGLAAQLKGRLAPAPEVAEGDAPMDYNGILNMFNVLNMHTGEFSTSVKSQHMAQLTPAKLHAIAKDVCANPGIISHPHANNRNAELLFEEWLEILFRCAWVCISGLKPARCWAIFLEDFFGRVQKIWHGRL
eukprot:jgi/Mesvir1/13141/Mv06110-RA.1